jgi:hypothetical protein
MVTTIFQFALQPRGSWCLADKHGAWGEAVWVFVHSPPCAGSRGQKVLDRFTVVRLISGIYLLLFSNQIHELLNMFEFWWSHVTTWLSLHLCMLLTYFHIFKNKYDSHLWQQACVACLIWACLYFFWIWTYMYVLLIIIENIHNTYHVQQMSPWRKT